MSLGYLGPKGSYSYEAAKLYSLADDNIAMRSFYEIIEAVEEGKIEKGILPIENSTEGAVTSVMDGLLKINQSKIIGEIILPVNHNLISLSDNIGQIKYIYSHIQALEQCREYLRKYLPDAKLITCVSTSEGCNIARERGKGHGAIANRESAILFNLPVLNSDIQDNPLNQTRFIVLGKETSECENPKTSIAFAFGDDRPGILYMALKEFADRNVNLTKVESRPAKTQLGKYVFYIDFIGSPKDDIIKEILCEIKKMTAFLKLLGTY